MTLFLKHKLKQTKNKLIKLDKEFKQTIDKYNQLANEYQNENVFSPLILNDNQQQNTGNLGQQAPAEAPPLNIKKNQDTEIIEV